MDGSTQLIEVDPATTCSDLCKLIKEKLGMKNIFGFSIYVAALEQVRSNSAQFWALRNFNWHETAATDLEEQHHQAESQNQGKTRYIKLPAEKSMQMFDYYIV